MANEYCWILDIIITYCWYILAVGTNESHWVEMIEVWYVNVQGGKDFLMRAHFGLPSVEAEEDEGRPPIKVKFEIPYFTVSGIQVRLDVIIFLE